jgi:uncharacterized protein (DUF2267 family)
VQWERYKRDSRYTGRLKVDDTAELQTDVRAANALVSGVEYLLFERLPEHEARSESAELGPQLREVWTDDHEILRRLRRR